MSGLGMVLDIASRALMAQSCGLDVTGHNIANVNTPGYSRQRPVFEPVDPFNFGGAWFGRGVNLEEVQRISDQFIESQVADEKSSLSFSKEAENYLQVLEGLFSESSESSVSSMLSDFWGRWHDISNNPSGDSERIALYEESILIAQQFNALDEDLTQLQTDLTNAVTAAIGEINQVTGEIAELNNQLAGAETNSIANDLRDKRNTLVNQLSEYLDVKTFEQENGSLTVVTAMGAVLVNLNENYELDMNGTAIEWASSSGATIDITDYITTGKLGGWLDVRDEVIAKHKLDLDALVEEFVWVVNEQHSEGVGLAGFSSATGTYSSSSPASAISTSASGLDYYNKVSTGTFRVYVYDSTGALANAANVTVTAGATTLNNIATAISAVDPDITATVNGSGQLDISTTNSHTFAFSNDTSGALAAIGVNTFFTGSTAGGIGMNSLIATNKDYIAAAQIDSATGDFATGDNTNAIDIADLQDTSSSIAQWTVDRVNGSTQGSVTSTIEDYYHAMVGSIGIKSGSVSRNRGFSELMLNKLEGIRDSISAVSLDEEMTNMIKFQHAYTAAAKLISVADEMMATLLAAK